MIQNILKKIQNKQFIEKKELLELIRTNSIPENIYQIADTIRKNECGDSFEMCSIMNAKSGLCSENCRFCAQSVHYNTDAPEFDLIDEEEAITLALKNAESGVHRFSLVTSGKKLNNSDFEKVLGIYRRLNQETDLKLCASLGLLSKKQAEALIDVGVTMYHHNIETSRNYYPNICTTHTYNERMETIKNIQSAGLDLCCGGIIGLGETWEDRIDMAFEIAELGIKSIPINVLQPIPGTPLEGTPPLSEEEILTAMALFRIVNPKAFIRYAGGRSNLSEENQKQGLQAGVNAALVGDHLTTLGSDVDKDKNIIQKSGYILK